MFKKRSLEEKAKQQKNSSQKQDNTSSSQSKQENKGINIPWKWLIYTLILAGGGFGIWWLVTDHRPQVIQEFDKNNCTKQWHEEDGKKYAVEASEKNIPSKEMQKKLQTQRAEAREDFFDQYDGARIITPVKSQQREIITLKEEGTLFLFFSQYRFGCGGQHTTVHGVKVTIKDYGTQEPRSPRTEFVQLAPQPLPEGTKIAIQRTVPSDAPFDKGGYIWNLDTYHPPKLVIVPTEEPFPWRILLGTALFTLVGGLLLGKLLFSDKSKDKTDTSKKEPQAPKGTSQKKEETPQESQSDDSDVQEGEFVDPLPRLLRGFKDIPLLPGGSDSGKSKKPQTPQLPLPPIIKGLLPAAKDDSKEQRPKRRPSMPRKSTSRRRTRSSAKRRKRRRNS